MPSKKNAWYLDLYDDFRMRTGFGQLPLEETKTDVDFIQEVLNLHKKAKILDLFCGIGRHSIELSKRGYSVTGIDLNPEYIKLGKQASKSIKNKPNFIQGDVRYTDFGKDFNASIIMYNSFGYFSDNEDKLILSKIFKSLKSGGRLLIEIHNRDWILKNFEELNEKEIEKIRVVEKRKFNILTNRIEFVISRYEKDGIITKKGAWRLYSAHEMKNILEEIGFKFINAYSNTEKAPLTINTRLMRLVFEK